MVAHLYSPNAKEAEAADSKLKVSLGYTVNFSDSKITHTLKISKENLLSGWPGSSG